MAKFGGSAFYPIFKDSVLIAGIEGEVGISVNDSLIFLESPLMQNKRLRFYGLNKHKPVRIKDDIYFHLGSNYLQSEPEFKEQPLLVSYNLKANNLKDIGFRYPPSFYDYCWADHQFSKSFTKNNNNQLVISLEISPNLYIYDPSSGTITANIQVENSVYLGSIKPYGSCEGADMSNYFQYLKSVGRYRGIIYDSNKNIYYRIISLPVEEEIDGQRTEDWLAPLSIMILDENFKVLTERKLPNRTYNPEDFFLTDEGLWISNNNELSSSFDEDQLSYTLFEFDKTIKNEK
jgi:hypothetical protein